MTVLPDRLTVVKPLASSHVTVESIYAQPLTRALLYQNDVYTLCSEKKRDHIFDDKLKQNYPFIKIFGTLITKSIGYRQVYLVSHLTYFVHLLYLRKLSRPKYHEFSLKLLIFSMLQY